MSIAKRTPVMDPFLVKCKDKRYFDLRGCKTMRNDIKSVCCTAQSAVFCVFKGNAISNEIYFWFLAHKMLQNLWLKLGYRAMRVRVAYV